MSRVVVYRQVNGVRPGTLAAIQGSNSHAYRVAVMRQYRRAKTLAKRSYRTGDYWRSIKVAREGFSATRPAGIVDYVVYSTDPAAKVIEYGRPNMKGKFVFHRLAGESSQYRK